MTTLQTILRLTATLVVAVFVAFPAFAKDKAPTQVLDMKAIPLEKLDTSAMYPWAEDPLGV